MMRLTVQNIGQSPTFVHSLAGRLSLNPGQSVDGDFSDGEAANIRANTVVFRTTEATTEAKTEPAPAKTITLAEAAAALDDAKDEDWTQAGLPSLARLKELTGGEVTRADADATGRKRATA